MRRGFTLLEVLIASAIMAIVFALAYAMIFSATQLSQSELALRDRQSQLQQVEDRLAAEIRESSPSLIRVTAFTDTALPSSSQTVLTIVSARNANQQFQVQNAAPSWQKVIVYAPYWDATLDTGELRRYEIAPAPGNFTDATRTPTVTVTATTLTLGGTTINRNQGQRLMMGVDHFLATIASNSVSLDVALMGGVLAKQSKIDLQTGATGRN